MSDEDRGKLLDTFSAVDLEAGYALACAYDEHGQAWPVIYDKRQTEPQYVPISLAEFIADGVAPHELLGALPTEFAQFRCGVRTRGGKGRPCRKRVAAPGERCEHHPAPKPPVMAAEPPQPPTVGAEVDQPALFDVDAQEPGR